MFSCEVSQLILSVLSNLSVCVYCLFAAKNNIYLLELLPTRNMRLHDIILSCAVQLIGRIHAVLSHIPYSGKFSRVAIFADVGF